MLKKCNKCGEEKMETKEFFRVRKDNGKFRNECIECMNKGDKRKYENNKRTILEKAKIYYEKNKKVILEKNKRTILEKAKIYYEKNKKVILEKNKIREKEHPRNRSEYMRSYYHEQKLKPKVLIQEKVCSVCDILKSIECFNNKIDGNDRKRRFCKECQSKKWETYYQDGDHKKDVRKRTKKFLENNPDFMRNYQREWQKEKRDTDPQYRLRGNIGRAIRSTLNGPKKSSLFSVLPYSPEELTEHLEKQFKDGMSWENYGILWEIDHIIPQSKLLYDSIEHENFLLCWRLENLQPLSIHDNRVKSAKTLDFPSIVC